MTRIQVVCASRHGGTAGIAMRIAQVLRTEGADVVSVDAADRPDAIGFDGFVIGSGVYMGSWLKEGIEFLERNQATLAMRPVWLFSSGPLSGSGEDSGNAQDPLTVALGPEAGPGSGGHRRIAALSAVIQPRAHRVFPGAYDPKGPARTLSERLVRLLPAARRALPAGDFREWDAIQAWANEVASELFATVPAG
jgi:menaquinone-dependent protoporphyrinogen oxidase